MGFFVHVIAMHTILQATLNPPLFFISYQLMRYHARNTCSFATVIA